MSEKFTNKIEIDTPEKYPEALSIDYLSEGGYRFLHRVFRTHFATGQPVVISTGGLYIQYEYKPGQTTFSEGLTVLEGDNGKTIDNFMDVANRFSLDLAFSENKIERPVD